VSHKGVSPANLQSLVLSLARGLQIDGTDTFLTPSRFEEFLVLFKTCPPRS
jgi:hypothetical protein